MPGAASVCICVTHMKRGYSGGRYHAWLLGEALAAAGHNVTIWTNHYPQYAADFVSSPAHDDICVCQDSSFARPPEGRFDWVIVIPDQDSPREYYECWVSLAFRCNAGVALLNFETPNWYNRLVHPAKDEALWDNWCLVSRFSDLIISSAEESSGYARRFYEDVLPGCRFVSCPPAINSLVADSITAVKKERQIIIITRLGGWHCSHKGADDLLDFLSPEMSGYTLALLTGNGIPDSAWKARLEKRAVELDIRLKFMTALTDQEKFTEIKRSRLMVFLSHFEGFGYPPVEAQYCGTPCVAYNLPVLREISGNGLEYVEKGDVEAFRAAVRRVLSSDAEDWAVLKSGIAHVASFDSFVLRVKAVFDEFSDRAGMAWQDAELSAQVEEWHRRPTKGRWRKAIADAGLLSSRFLRKLERLGGRR
jgi:glycosyltransferase involved in cell wall biosynthesis